MKLSTLVTNIYNLYIDGHTTYEIWCKLESYHRDILDPRDINEMIDLINSLKYPN